MSSVTVVITSANRHELLCEALESVLKQTYQDFEVFVSDNSNDDQCEKAVRKFASERIRIQRHVPALFWVDNWRYALLRSKTEFVAFLHDDDQWEPEHLQRGIDLLKEHSSAQMYSCPVLFFDEYNEPGFPFGLEHIDVVTVIPPQLGAMLWVRACLAQCSTLIFRRAALDGLDWGPKNEMSYLDWFLWAQISAKAHWIYDPRIAVRFRIHPQSGSKTLGRSLIPKGHYSLRRVVQNALPYIRNNREQFLNLVDVWPLAWRSRVLIPLMHIGAGRELWALGAEIRKRDPQILHDSKSVFHCRVAGRIGLIYLYFAELIDRLRGWWWPKH